MNNWAPPPPSHPKIESAWVFGSLQGWEETPTQEHFPLKFQLSYPERSNEFFSPRLDADQDFFIISPLVITLEKPQSKKTNIAQ